MVVLLQEYDMEEDETIKHGAIHHAELLEAHDEDFRRRYQHMQKDAYPYASGLPSRELDSVRDVCRAASRAFHEAPLCLKHESSVKEHFTPPYGMFATILAPWKYREQLLELDTTDVVAPPEKPVDLSDVHIWQNDFSFDEDKTSTMLAIAPNGLVILNDARETPIEGEVAFYIPDGSRQQIIDTCLENEIFSSDHTHIKPDEEAPLPAISTGIRVGEHQKWVHDFTSTPPAAVQEVEQAIKTACYVDLWLNPDFETLLAGLEDDTKPNGPYLSILHAAGEQGVIEVTEPQALFEAVEPLLSASSNLVRYHAAKIAAQVAHETDLSASQLTQFLHQLLDDDDDGITDAAGDLLRLMSVTDRSFIPSILDSADETVVEQTLTQLEQIARNHPSRFSSLTDTFAVLFRDGTESMRESTAVILHYIAEEEGIEDTATHSLLIDGVTDSSDTIQRHCIQALAAIAPENPESVMDAVPAVAPLLEHSRDSLRRPALTVLREVSRTHPEEVRPVVPQLVELIESEELTVETTSVLGQIAKPYPAVARPLIDTFKQWLDIEDTRRKNNAVASLVDFAKIHPERVVDKSETFIELLDAEDEYIQRNATTIVSRLAQTHPERLMAAVPKLKTYLDHEHPQTRANACWGLGRLNATGVKSDLERMRTEDEPDSVQAAAIAALTMIETDRCPECDAECQAHNIDLRVVFPLRIEWECPHCESDIIEQLSTAESGS